MTTFLTLGLTSGKSDSQNQKLPRIRIRFRVRIRIRIKMIGIRNTAFSITTYFENSSEKNKRVRFSAVNSLKINTIDSRPYF